MKISLFKDAKIFEFLLLENDILSTVILVVMIFAGVVFEEGIFNVVF